MSLASLSNENMVDMYITMLKIRKFEEKASKLFLLKGKYRICTLVYG